MNNRIFRSALAGMSAMLLSSAHAQVSAADSMLPLGQLPGDNLRPDFTRANPFPDQRRTRRLWLAWDAGRAGARDIFVREYETALEQWTVPLALTSNSGRNQSPDIENLGDSVLVVWESNRRGNFDIEYSLFDGGAWAIPAPINAETPDDHHPILFSWYNDFAGPRWNHEALTAWEREAVLMWSRVVGKKWSTPRSVPAAFDSAK